MPDPARCDTELAVTALAVARRFSGGATMWALSPQWPEHGHHLAVEFVHPVIVGKRALPAVHVDADGAVAQLRSMARPGDIVVAVSPSGDAIVEDVVRRAPAWGVLTVWLGTGPRPAKAMPDHLVWFDESGPLARHDGTLVFGYHVLWELVHVCFEHSGLLTEDGAADATCITCRDEGRLAEVVATGEGGRSSVRTASGVEIVDTTIVEPVMPGDLVLVHAGTAITKVDG